jgi:hypothetical protein
MVFLRPKSLGRGNWPTADARGSAQPVAERRLLPQHLQDALQRGGWSLVPARDQPEAVGACAELDVEQASERARAYGRTNSRGSAATESLMRNSDRMSGAATVSNTQVGGGRPFCSHSVSRRWRRSAPAGGSTQGWVATSASASRRRPASGWRGRATTQNSSGTSGSKCSSGTSEASPTRAMTRSWRDSSRPLTSARLVSMCTLTTMFGSSRASRRRAAGR